MIPYSLEMVTTATAELLATSDIKAHSRIDTTEQDTLIAALITSAREHVEKITHRSLVSIQWRMRMDRWPSWEILLPKPPVTTLATTDVTFISSTESAADSTNYTTMPSTDWIFDQYSEPARITPAFGRSWPSAKGVMNSVRVVFTSGYTTDTIPDALIHCQKLLAAHWYENREAVVTGTISKELEFTVNALAGSYRFGNLH